MDYNLIIGILSLIVAIGGYNLAKKIAKKDYEEKPEEDKLHLTAQFKATQNLSKQVYNELKSHVETYNAFDQFMFPGITYRAYLSELEKSHSADNGCLSDKTLEKSLSLWPLPLMTIQSMSKSLEDQFRALTEIQNSIRLQKETIRLNDSTSN
ncbi:hypothetical protein [Edaphocola flava]|uniref:hypothetical protein n=1 Tax=Edaphocola flava TaxID=2499629 RepID=UPI00100B6131|nr:hypothetical protein [Edaphocola flava]